VRTIAYLAAGKQHDMPHTAHLTRSKVPQLRPNVCAPPCRQSAVTRLAALPGGRLLASADEDGHLVATDVRTLGGGPAGDTRSSDVCGHQW
jgi:hypothetical protein